MARDYEVPLGVPVAYHARVWSAEGEASPEAATVTVTVDAEWCEAWLMDIAAPGNSQTVEIESLNELAHEAPTGVHWVLDRRAPITTGEVARTPTFEIGLITETDEAREKARNALGNGYPVLLRTAPELSIGNLYFVVPKWSEQRVLRDGRSDLRRFLCQAVQIERPAADLWLPLVPVETYDEVRATFATYADVKAERDSYDDLLHSPIGDSPPVAPVIPWPAMDV